MIKLLRKLISFWPRNWRAAPSYHDLHITTVKMPRTSIFNLPFRVQVHCSRTGGWQVWALEEDGLPAMLIAGEYDENWLVLDVAGFVIVDSPGKRQR
jgi:hypothetical protein